MKYSLADDILVLNSVVANGAMKPKSWERIRAYLEWHEKMNPQCHTNYQMVSEKKPQAPFIMNGPPSDVSKPEQDLGEQIFIEATPFVGGRIETTITEHARYLSDLGSSYGRELQAENERFNPDTDMKRIQSLEAVDVEIQRQTELKQSGRFKFCVADAGMNDFERLAVLGEEFGEVSHEVNETIGGHRPLDILRIKKELIQVAAVAVAWFERF